ncbi:uncharacterized protein [Drosophila pseudoobscura]|uniref:Uncharacterized protein n=1 Tax=Drosophila pseudoobscura pseudoobscura TaxID=46245 RepID=A0A6I8W7X5_DROPS|nr:uncharacterized protein LOC6899901 [Drosophila pseudoobscura]
MPLGMLLKIVLLLLLLAGAYNGLHVPNYNEGDCDFIYKIRLMRVCKSTVSKRIAATYADVRAPSGTPYSLWVVPNATDMILASFHSSKLLNRKYMEIINYKIDESLKHSDMHCMSTPMKYVAHLMAHCKKRKFDAEDTCPRPVLHYTMEGPERHDSDTALRVLGDWRLLLPTILLIRVWSIIEWD